MVEDGRKNNDSGAQGEEMVVLNGPLAEPYDPHEHRNVSHATNNRETLIHILKGSLGTGILAMPKAFSNSGVIFGTIGTILIGFLCTYCLHVLVRCQYDVCKRLRKPVLSYPETMKYSLKQGPPCMRFAADISGPIVDAFLIVYQLGICAVYIVFIGVNLEQGLKNFFPNIGIQTYMIIALIPIMLITMIKNLKLLAPFSQLANVITFLGLGIILYYVFRDFKMHESVDYVGIPMKYTLFVGVTLFALEAVGVVLAVENNMKTPKSFGKVLNQGMSIIVFMYAFMGLIGYLRYGETIADSITVNLPTDTWLAQSVKMIFVVAVYISYALQCYVPIDIFWNNYVKDKVGGKEIYQYILRIFVVLLTFLMAITIPYLELSISLFGALSLSALGIVFPAIIEICLLYPDNLGPFKCILYKNILIIVVGICAGALGTGISVREIVLKIKAGE